LDDHNLKAWKQAINALGQAFANLLPCSSYFLGRFGCRERRQLLIELLVLGASRLIRPRLYIGNRRFISSSSSSPPSVIPLRKVRGDPSVGSLTLASIATYKEADSKRPTKF